MRVEGTGDMRGRPDFRVGTRRVSASRLIALALIGAALHGCAPAPSGGTDTAGDWPLLGRTADGQRYAPLEGITAQNATRLGLAFEFDDFVVRGRTHRGVEGSPLMVDGILYFSGPWGVAYAIDARTGRHLWTYDPEADGESARNACCDAVNRGIAVADGRLFTAGTDGHLAAVDVRTGKEVWKVDTILRNGFNYSSTGAPYVAGKYVLIGNSGADMGSRGYVSAYDRATGKLAWRFWAVPGDPAAGPDETPDVSFARKTWPSDARWDLGLGGNAWDGLAYDPETNTAYLALGNGGPHPAWLRSRSGAAMDELFLTSIVAVDADTGRRKWHYQTTPGDSWDYAATSPLVFADLTIDGKPRKVVMQAPKNGFFYVLDRHSGELLRADPYTDVNWASSVDLKTGRPVLTGQGDYRSGPRIVKPGPTGGHSWAPMAFSPRTGLVYLPVFESAATYQADESAGLLPGTINQASRNVFPPFSDPAVQAQVAKASPLRFEGRLKAWDPVAGKARWISDRLTFLSSGTLVSGDLVFQGTADGYLRAYDAATGKRIAEHFIGTSIMAAPITYELDGVQYIAVMAGAGGPQGSGFGPDVVASKRENRERLVVLRLDGGPVPVPPERQPVDLQPLPARIAASPETLRQGQALYERHCHRCHTVGGAVGNYPNLWNMDPAVLDAFSQIVSEGVLSYAGMGNFSDVLRPQDVAAIKAFIVNDMIEKRRHGQQAGAQFRDASH